MADQIIINVPPYDGAYDLDIAGQPFSTVEWRWLKRISGYMPLTIDEGWKGGDPDLFLAFAVIAMRRAGKIQKDEVLEVAAVIEEAAVDGTSITFKGDEAEVDETNPPLPSSSADSPLDSGESSSASTETSPETESPSSSGTPALDTGSDSDRLTLAQ